MIYVVLHCSLFSLLGLCFAMLRGHMFATWPHFNVLEAAIPASSFLRTVCFAGSKIVIMP